MRKKQVIAVDIDDVLAISAAEFVAYSNQRWGTNLKVEDYHEDWSVMWQVDRETEHQRAQEIYNTGFFEAIPHDAAAIDVLKQLSHNYELVVATSRVSVVHKDTLEWLERHFRGLFKDVHMSGIYDAVAYGPLETGGQHMLTKAELIKRVGADFLIDDQPKHCLAVADLGVETILFGDYGWNRDIGPLPERVTRCADWAAVGEYFAGR